MDTLTNICCRYMYYGESLKRGYILNNLVYTNVKTLSSQIRFQIEQFQ